MNSVINGIKGDKRITKFNKVINKIFNELIQSSISKSPFSLPLLSLIYQFVNLSKNCNNSWTTV